MDQKLQQLKAYAQEIYDLSSCMQVLEWDQMTYMPSKAAQARGRQIATISRILHQKKTDPKLGQLLEDLFTFENELPAESNEFALIREMKREYERFMRVPSDFVAQFSEHCTKKVQAWAEARAQDRFEIVAPYLEETLRMTRQYARFFPETEHIADTLIHHEDPGLTVSIIQPLFAQLKEKQELLLEEIVARPKPDDSFLYLHYPKDQQLHFIKQVLLQLGFDPSRTRQDFSLHPFMMAFAHDDVRITTRVDERNLMEALFSSIHEMGHAIYELGIDSKLEGTPLHRGVSSFVHESQSRLWENMVGRSKAFWQFFYPKLKEQFPSQLGNVSLNQFYQAINRVEPSLIRTDADEVTYNLHVMIRFELELSLLEGKLAVRDLPDAWREAYQSTLGVSPQTDQEGVLQDIHWYSSWIAGMFHSYALGNILSSQIYQAATQEIDSLEEQIEQGNFQPLLTWLTKHVYQHGSKFPPMELIERVTGSTLTIEPYIDYLFRKFS